MRALNADAVIKYVTSKQVEYRKRRDAAELEGNVQGTADYNIRLLPLDNLMIRIARGDFDILSLKPELKIEQGVPHIIEKDWDLKEPENEVEKDES